MGTCLDVGLLAAFLTITGFLIGLTALLVVLGYLDRPNQSSVAMTRTPDRRAPR